MLKEEIKFADSNIFEGMVSIRSILAAADAGISDRHIIRVMVDRDKQKKRSRELSYIKARSAELNYNIEYMSASELNAYTLGNSHGGIICEASARTILPLEETADLADNGFYVMLDGIEDPYNFGYALRSIYASGADGIILTPRNWMNAAGVVCRASAGASEMLPMYTCEPNKALEIFSKKGYLTVSADTENSESVYSCDLKYPLFLIVGGEKRGIGKAILEKCDKIVHLDYGREFPKALSAASAASILAFEIMRQNRHSR